MPAKFISADTYGVQPLAMPAVYISADTYGVQPLAMPALFISADTYGVQPLAMPALSWLTATYQIQDLQCYCFVHDAEEITSPVKKRNKLLHLGGTQLQAVAYSLPGAIATLNEKEDDEEIYKVLVVIKANVVVVGEEITMNLAVYVLLGLCSVTSAIVSVISLSNAELPIRDHLPDSETQAESVEGMETQMFDRSQTIVAT
ncbi:hypothetical protein ACLKA7_017704 [Drosophila subpalustris]